jgi:BlaI family transcriptional regulator, penicillinase repressor
MKLTEAEWQVMNALWIEHPATARQVVDRLPRQVRWAYTTVKTMLTRLAEKGAVRESKQGSISLYDPLVSQRNARLHAVRSLLDQAFDGAMGPLMHFLVEERQLTPKVKKELMQVFQEEAKRKGKKS